MQRRRVMRSESIEPVVFVDPVVNQFDWAIYAILVALLTFLPAALGSFQPWNEAIAAYIAFAALIALGIKLIVRPDQRFVWSWTYLPLALLVVYILFQLVPLPQGLMRVLAPATLEDRLRLAAVLPADIRPSRFPLSFYPFGTLHDLRNLLVTIAVFIVSLNFAKRPSPIKKLLWAIAIIGAASSILQMAQVLSGATGIYWVFPPERDLPNAGTFPNHNFFSQFTNVSSGAALALLLLTIDDTFHRHDYTPAELFEKLKSRKFVPAYVLAFILSINVASVFLSLSRGGALSIVVSGVVTAVLLAIRGGRRGMGLAGWFATVVMLFVFLIVLLTGAEVIEARLKTITSRADRVSRLQITYETADMWRHYPLTGSGFGTFRYVFPRFGRSEGDFTVTHAEDEYVELLAELGIAGGACVVAFGAMIFAAFFQAQARTKRLVAADNAPSPPQSRGEMARSSPGQRSESRRRSGASVASSLSIGIGFGLIAMLVQSATDFAFHFLSVSCLVAAECAVLINLATLRRQERGLSTENDSDYASHFVLLRRRLVRSGALVVTAGVAALVIWQATVVWSGDRVWYRVREAAKDITDRKGIGTEGAVADMNRYGREAVQICPHDVHFLYEAALNRGFTLPSNLSALQRWTELMACTRQLQLACLACPTYGPAYCQIGQWQQNELGQWMQGVEPIRLAWWLAPSNATAAYVAAGLYADEKEWPAAIATFKRSIELESDILPDAIDVFLDDYHRPDLLFDLVGNDPDSLKTLSDKLRTREKQLYGPATTEPSTKPINSKSLGRTALIDQYEQIAAEADRRIDLAIMAAAQSSNATSAQLGAMAMLLVKNDHLAESLPYFQKALTLEYGQQQWRMSYAKALIATHNDDEAYQQLQIVLRRDLQNDEAHQLSEQILVRRAMANPDVEKLRSANPPLVPVPSN